MYDEKHLKMGVMGSAGLFDCCIYSRLAGVFEVGLVHRDKSIRLECRCLQKYFLI
jgi:hypothetical protein